MKRIMDYELRIMVFFVLSIILTSLFIPHIIFAVDSTPSADIKIKLDELKKEIASKAAELKQLIDQKLKDRAYVGKIKTKSDTSLTLATDNGPKIVNINQDANFESKVKKQIYAAKLMTEEDYIAALGDVDENGVLTARQIVLLPKTEEQSKTYLWGQVAAISDKLVTLKDRSFKNMAASLIDSADVKIGNFVILTGSLGKNNFFDTDFVYVIPQGGILKPKKIATPAAQISSP